MTDTIRIIAAATNETGSVVELWRNALRGETGVAVNGSDVMYRGCDTPVAFMKRLLDRFGPRVVGDLLVDAIERS